LKNKKEERNGGGGEANGEEKQRERRSGGKGDANGEEKRRWDSDPEDPEIVLSDPELEFVEARVSRRSPAPSCRRLPASSERSLHADRTAPQPEAVTPVIPPAVELEASGPSISAGGRSSSVLTTPPASPLVIHQEKPAM
jgi:hypothetical protein